MTDGNSMVKEVTISTWLHIKSWCHVFIIGQKEFFEKIKSFARIHNWGFKCWRLIQFSYRFYCKLLYWGTWLLCNYRTGCEGLFTCNCFPVTNTFSAKITFEYRTSHASFASKTRTSRIPLRNINLSLLTRGKLKYLPLRCML